MSSNDNIKLIEDFFAALEAEDQDAATDFYADHVKVWHNADDKWKDKAGSLAILKSVFGLLSKPNYEVIRREVIEGGVLQQHILHATMPDGAAFAIPAIIVFTCEGDKIVKLEEYVDSTSFNRQMKQAVAAKGK